jgi:hypothetical protein
MIGDFAGKIACSDDGDANAADHHPRSGDALVEFRPSGIKLDAVVLAKGPDLLGERAINRLTQRDVGAMIDRGR